MKNIMKIKNIFMHFCLLAASLAMLGCSAKAEAPIVVEPPKAVVSAEWDHIVNRLKQDKLYDDNVMNALSVFMKPSEDPMGRKIHELYRNKYREKPKPKPKDPKDETAKKPTKPTQPVYKGVITKDNIQKCLDFLTLHEKAFAAAEKKYFVPKEVAVALLFVETRLGTYLGKEEAFYTLASMANSTKFEQIESYKPKLNTISPSDDKAKIAWIEETMVKRSDWAYKELKALITHLQTNKLDFHQPGSIYGAMGLCQFMPSNFVPYGADGNADGVIDLFEPADAIASLSRYLNKHGWKPNISYSRRHAILKRYNNLNIYANTILRLAEAVRKAEVAKKASSAKKSSSAKVVTKK